MKIRNEPQDRSRWRKATHYLYAILGLSGALWGVAVTSATPPGDTQPQRRTPVVAVFEAAKDSVVNIASTQIVQMRSPSGMDRLFEQLFDLPTASPFSRRYQRTSVGSGFVLHPSGYIVTNAHVVARTADRKVIFADGRSLEAQVIASDPERDLAILKIDTHTPLKPLALGHSHDLMVGETVVAIGNPLGYQHTVTAGVVSALDRTLDFDHHLSFKGLIQTDASINPGNSGGPLLNVLGELIGVNTAIRGDAQNIGFAIPVDQLRQILPSLLDVERRYRITTGIQVSSMGPCRVAAIQPQSPAATILLRVGDEIIRIGDQPVRTVVDYHLALVGCSADQSIPIHVLRHGQAISLTLNLASRPKPDGAKLLWQRFGIEATPLTRKMAHAMGLGQLHGVLIKRVDHGMDPARLPFQRGDVIVQIGRHQLKSLEDIGALLEPLKAGQTVRITVLRVVGRMIYRFVADVNVK